MIRSEKNGSLRGGLKPTFQKPKCSKPPPAGLKRRLTSWSKMLPVRKRFRNLAADFSIREVSSFWFLLQPPVTSSTVVGSSARTMARRMVGFALTFTNFP